MSSYEKVLQFTRESGFPIPDEPEKMSEDEVFFLAKMLLDEIMEMCASVSYSKDYKQRLIKLIEDSRDYNVNFTTMSDDEIIAEQVDSVVDQMYYAFNAMAKKNVDVSKVFDLVHEANMNKKIDGVFLKRADGKIIKPPNWRTPDIVSEVKRQRSEKKKKTTSSSFSSETSDS